ncbi:MAG TPA: cytochrome C oxidase subunit IV family protein [Polyangia bacterium]|jgi:cytochrome c oxidase subunit 4|nr:cytochrome C oxidase subunit IV family protein [Polyangia bacterium]
MKRYVFIWLALLTLTGATVGVASLNLGDWALAAALIIAAIKATLVALFFMHLLEQRASYRVALVVSLLFVAVLVTFTVLDVRTRFVPVMPQEAYTGVPEEAFPEAPPVRSAPAGQQTGAKAEPEAR